MFDIGWFGRRRVGALKCIAMRIVYPPMVPGGVTLV
jgi:hypothetical protein